MHDAPSICTEPLLKDDPGVESHKVQEEHDAASMCEENDQPSHTLPTDPELHRSLFVLLCVLYQHHSFLEEEGQEENGHTEDGGPNRSEEEIKGHKHCIPGLLFFFRHTAGFGT